MVRGGRLYSPGAWEAVLLLSQHETGLWEAYATEPCFATCYDVDTQTWHPEWVTVNAAGQLAFVEPEEPHDD
jgi:hypothetical protein